MLLPQEIQFYRKLLQEISGLRDDDDRIGSKGFGFSQSDGVVKREIFWPLIYNNRLIAALKDIFSDTPKFIQHSDLHVNYGDVGWHRDNANRNYNKGPDWDESKSPYSNVRVAIYLQTFEESKFKMGVIPGSHQQESFLNTCELKLAAVYKRLINKLPPFYLSLKPEWMQIDAGDCLIFDQRLLHTGSKIMGPKYSIYLGYGIDNEHSRRHAEYFINRKDLEYEAFSPQLAHILREKNLLPSFLENNIRQDNTL